MYKTCRLASLFILCNLSSLPNAISAEAPRSKQQLKKMASHIVVGKILGIYEKKEKIKDDDGFSWERTRSVAEVQIERTEKGEGIDKKNPLYIKYWSQRANGFFPVPGLTGQWENFKEGDSLRIYLAKQVTDGYKVNQDGGYHVIGPNGFEKPKSSTSN